MHAVAVVSIGHAFLNYILINILRKHARPRLSGLCLAGLPLPFGDADFKYWLLMTCKIQALTMSMSCQATTYSRASAAAGWMVACMVSRCVRACVRTKDTITTAHIICNWCRQMPSCICTKNNQTTCCQRDVCGDVPPPVVRDDVTSGICVTIIWNSINIISISIIRMAWIVLWILTVSRPQFHSTPLFCCCRYSPYFPCASIRQFLTTRCT